MTHCQAISSRSAPHRLLAYRFLARARLTGGVDEPLEERVFGDLLPQLPAGSVVLELGSFWAFYSLWLRAAVDDAAVHLVEPVTSNLARGITTSSGTAGSAGSSSPGPGSEPGAAGAARSR